MICKFNGIYICERQAALANDGKSMIITIPVGYAKDGYFTRVTTNAVELYQDETETRAPSHSQEVVIPANLLGIGHDWFTIRHDMERDVVIIEPRVLNPMNGRYEGECTMIKQDENTARIELPQEYKRYSACQQYFDPETKAIVLIPRPRKLPVGMIAGWKVKSVLDLEYQGMATIRCETSAICENGTPYAYIHYSADMVPDIDEPHMHKYGRYITSKTHIVSLFPHEYVNEWEYPPEDASPACDSEEEAGVNPISEMMFIETQRLGSWHNNGAISYVIRLPEQFCGVFLQKHVNEKGIITLAKDMNAVNEFGRWFSASKVRSSPNHKGVLDLGRPCSRYLDQIGERSVYYDIYLGKDDKITLIPHDG